MNKLKVLSLFSGIGAFEKGLTNLGIDYELVGFSEIDKYAIKSYCLIHNVNEKLNIGDISEVNENDIPSFDLMTYGFPCQDISLAGRLKGFSKSSETRSSLLWEAMRVARHHKPKYMVAENVRNLIGKKFKDDFNRWMEELDEMGYVSYYQILNSKDFSIPQNRERVFVISIRKDIDQGSFKFPNGSLDNVLLKDLLEKEVEEKYYLNDQAQSRLKFKGDVNNLSDIQSCAMRGRYDSQGNTEQHLEVRGDEIANCITTVQKDSMLLIKNATKRGFLEAFDGDGIDLSYPDSKTRRGRVQPQRSHTLTTSDNLGVLEGHRIRKLTPRESWRLMGFSDEDYNKVKENGLSERQLYKQAGNSIVVNVAQELLRNLLRVNYTYKIVDVQSNETVADNQSLNDLIQFAHDLYWQEDVDFENYTYEEVKQAIEGCDYEVTAY